MKVLALTSSGPAPTHDPKFLRQIDYINQFPGMSVELGRDWPLHEIERKIIAEKYDCVFPAVVFDFQPGQEDRCQFNAGLYDVLLYHHQDYIGSDVFSQMLLNDKALASYRSGIGLPGIVMTRSLWENHPDLAFKQLEGIDWPVIVKPNTLSASLGITKESIVYSPEETAAVIKHDFLRFPALSEVLLEKYLSEGHEYTVSVTGNGEYVICCPTALDSKLGKYEIFSFENKNAAPSERSVAYNIVEDPSVAEQLKRQAKELAELFALRDYCRFDFLMDRDQNLYLIDGNTIPALGRNYMYQYTSSGILAPNQIFALILAAYAKRSGSALPVQLLDSLPRSLLEQLGF